MQNAKLMLTCLAFAGLAALAGCSFPGVYKIDIQQGNVVTQDMIDQLRPGMTRRQVRFIMGNPLIVDTFHANRWDYLYSIQPGGGRRQQERVSLFFNDSDQLAGLNGDFMPGVSREELLSVAALAESRSNHPIARSVLRAALAAGLGTEKDAAVSAMREIPGKGVEVTADGAQVLAGNAALLEAYNITPLPVDMPGSVVQVARDGRALGALVVSDRIKPQAPGALEALRRLGVDVLAMLTGDRQSQARPVAKELGLDVLKADLLPEDKASALEALGPTRQTLMVGDGINDAPVLATAGVGVAMGGLGSEAAIETADVVILDDNPQRLPELLRIARRTRRIVWENIVLALGIKGLFMGLGIVGLSGLWEAVFADVGVALLAVLNASRAGRI